MRKAVHLGEIEWDGAYAKHVGRCIELAGRIWDHEPDT